MSIHVTILPNQTQEGQLNLSEIYSNITLKYLPSMYVILTIMLRNNSVPQRGQSGVIPDRKYVL